MKVLVLNQYAGNKGDRAVCHFVVRELERNRTAQITVSTHQRSFWRKNPFSDRVSFVPWGWNVEPPREPSRFNRRITWEKRRLTRRVFFPLVTNAMLRGGKALPTALVANREFCAAARMADLVLSTGGHHVTTRFGPNAVVEMIYDMMLALLLQKRLVLWSQTIGPLQFTNRRNEQGVRHILDHAHSIYVRDDSSLEVLRSFQVNNPNIRRTFESVLGLNDCIEAYIPMKDREAAAGITIYNAEARTASGEDKYCTTIAQIADYLIHSGLRVRFFPHEMKGATIDDRACVRKVMERMKRVSEASIVDEDLDAVSHLKEIAKCRLFLGHKTHSVVFALAVGTPVVAISYHPKTVGFMQDYGLLQNCIPEQELSLENFSRILGGLLQNLDLFGEIQFSKSTILGAAVRRDFHQMLEHFERRNVPTTEASSQP